MYIVVKTHTENAKDRCKLEEIIILERKQHM